MVGSALLRRLAQEDCPPFSPSRRTGVAKLLFLGSSCIYQRLAPQPMSETYLLTGPLEPTNE
jgi:hypothetical protein